MATNCPAGAIASSGQSLIPSDASPGYLWAPVPYPGTGWCEVKA